MAALSFDDLTGNAPLSEDEASGALSLAAQESGGAGPVRVTSQYRTPEHNRAIGGAPNSMHTWGSGEAVDFQLPVGTDPDKVRGQLEAEGYPVTEWLVEHAGDQYSTGPHIHWGWGKKGTAAAAPAAPAAGPVTFSDLDGGKGGPVTFGDLNAAPAMPNPLTAMVQGIVSSGKDVAQTFTGKRQPDTGSPASEPLHFGDLLHPMDALSKIAYGFGASSPMIAGGVAGAVAGGAIPGLGETGIPEVTGGALGASLGTAIQALGPRYAAELKKTPKDPDGAFDRAVKRAGLESAESGASWAAFAYAPFRNQVKNLLLQAFAVQPGISMAAKAITNRNDGRPTMEGMGETYLQGSAGTLVPAAGHALASIALSRMGLHTQASMAAEKAKEEARTEPVAEAPPLKPARPDLLEMAAIPKPGQKEPTASVPAAAPDAAGLKAMSGQTWSAIGFNSQGRPVYEDQRGARTYINSQGKQVDERGMLNLSADPWSRGAFTPAHNGEYGKRDPRYIVEESEPAAPEPFKTTPAQIAQEHALETAQIENHGAKAAVEENPYLRRQRELDAQAGLPEKPADDDRAGWVDYTNKAYRAAQGVEDPELLQHVQRANSFGNYMVDSIDHKAQMERAEPVAEMVLPPLKGSRKNTPIGRVRIMQDPESGKFGVGTDYDLSGFAGGGGPIGGRGQLAFNFDSAQEALDYAKDRMRVDPSNFGTAAPPRAIKEAGVLNDWLDKLALPTGASPAGGEQPPAAAEPSAEPERPVADERYKEVGQSSQGRTLFEDKNGVRSYVENGVRITEPVQLRPTRGGMQYVVDRGAHPEFATPDEAKALAPSLPEPVAPPAAPEHPKAIQLADAVLGHFRQSAGPLTANMLQRMAEEIYGGTLASGAIARDEMYDAAEMGLNLFLRSFTGRAGHGRFSAAVDETNAQARAEAIAALKDRLPTQTVRAGEKETHQQFSTPPDYSYAGAWAANLHPSDVVLEPSAGMGSFVTHALNAGVREVHANELSDRRADMLRALDPTNITRENAEHIDALLPEQVKPTVVLMNPPFSAAATRMKGRMVLEVGAKHVEAALKKLAPGGRLVAIVGKGMAPDAPTFRSWWNRIGKEYDVRANIGVEGGIYRKYGTTFPTRLLVIDKNSPSGRSVLKVENLKSAADIIRALKDVRNDRLHLAGEQPLPEPAGEALAGRGEGTGEPSAPLPPAAGPVGPREGGEPERPGGTAGTREPGERAPGGAGKRGGRAGTRVPLADQQPERPESGGTVEHAGTRIDPGEGPLSGSSGGAGDGIRPDGSGERVEPGVTEAPATVQATEVSLSESPDTAPITDAVYEPYRPQKVTVKGAKPHPGPLVQSAAMASVEPPKPNHSLAIPDRIIKDGALSDAQLEAVIYAGHSHGGTLQPTEDLPERRRGFFIGDGTGVGKGREVAGIILDNWAQGRRKHIWVSEKKPLLKDARRDWTGIGQDEKDVLDHSKYKAGDAISAKQGVLFTTYDTLKSAEQLKQKDEKTGKAAKGKTRVQQILDWAGPDFDGVIAFDESHNLGNSFDTKGNRGIKKAAAKALAGVELQNKLPKARVVYVSATGATEVSNLGYADRLGLWGRGTAFANRNDFMAKVQKGGIAAMELVARDMKAMGRYIARNLSYDGVEYDRVEHTLSPDQRAIYNELADAWQLVLRNFTAAMEKAGITETTADGGSKTKSAQAKSAILSQFWGTHQRFFNQVITSMQMPTVIRHVEKDLAEGRQAVLQLVNTNEAAQERSLAKIREEGGEEEALEDLDMTPRDQLLQMVKNAYPVNRFEEYVDESGNVRTRPVFDSEGKPVLDPDLVAAREALLDKLGAIRVPDGPLETLLNHFGTEKVAEVTGRKERVVRKPDEKTGEMRTVVEKRPGSSNLVEADLFQEAKKPVLVFSEAGGTGRSYHADVTSSSADKRRSHYLVQAGWRADKAVQGFGRTHRTNQASAPIFHLVTTDLQGQKRFISSIARRLGQLGALTKGERRTGDQGMFGLRDNLESDEAKVALQGFFGDALAGEIPGVGLDVLQDQMGLKLIEDTTGRQLQEMPPMTQFLNRILSLRTDKQNLVFDEFSKRLDDVIDRAAAAGTLDTGVETFRADKIAKRSEQVVYTDPESGAQTRHVHLETQRKVFPADYASVVTRLRSHNADGSTPFVRSVKSGKVFGVQDATARTDTKTGSITEQKRLVGPLDYQFIESHRLDDDRYWQLIEKPDQQAAAWAEQVAKIPEFAKSDLHLITGAVLPIWDRLQGNPRIYRLQTDAGEKMLGRVIPNDSVADTLKALGAEAMKVKETPEQVAQGILEDGRVAKLANDWTIQKRMVAGEPRLELIGPDHLFMAQLQQDGVFTERIDWKTRFFIPTEPAAAARVIENITRNRPIVQLSKPTREASQHARMNIFVRPLIEGLDPEPPFFSALTRAVEGVKLSRATAKDWLGLIGNLAQKGVKQEEIDWSGVRDWLQAQTKPVTKDEVLQHLRENEVQVHDVEKGKLGPEPTNSEYQAVWDWIQNQSGAPERERINALRMLDEATTEGIASDVAALEEFGVPNHLIGPYREYVNKSGGATKFGIHRLPGGENYRELLLTLPAKQRPPIKELRVEPFINRNGGHDWQSYVNGEKWIAVGDRTEQHAIDRIRRLWGEPDSSEIYRSSHWEEPNVLAHVRFDDRTGPNGEKVLHIAEIQSDWHQRGRKSGYKSTGDDRKKLDALEAEYNRNLQEINRSGLRVVHERREYTEQELKRHEQLVQRNADLGAEMNAINDRDRYGVPEAPFKTSWHELAMKRMLRYAAEHGYDRVTWDTGETNADRYDLSQYVDSIRVAKDQHGKYRLVAFKDGRGENIANDIAPEKLPEYVGKDLAQKIVDEKLGFGGEKTYSGPDLRVGGHGMRAFYDRILPQFLAKYAKRFGAKPEFIPAKKPLETGVAHHAGTTVEKLRAMGQHARDVLVAQYKRSKAYGDEAGRHSIDITPAMRESVMKGQPLFRREAIRPGPRGTLTRLAHDVVAELPATPSPQEREVIDRVGEIARKIVPGAEVVATRHLYPEGALGRARAGEEIAGVTTRGARRLIAWSLAAADAQGVMRHEAIHWLRANGFFKPSEWAMLERAARTGDWIGRWNIRERYPDVPFESQLEEAIAEQFGYWRRGIKGVPEIVRPLFERLAQVLGRVRDYLRQQFGHDVSTENIFHRIEAGEIGGRTPADLAQPVRPFGKRGALSEMSPSLFAKMDPEERENRLVEVTRNLINVGEDFQMLMAPMTRGSDMAKATVKDFLNLIRAGGDYGQFRIKQLGKRYTHKELKRMWEAADQESILRQQGVTDMRGRGLSTLTDREREAVEHDQADANAVWNAMVKSGQVEGEGLPSYVPHMYVEVGETGYRRLGSNRGLRSIPGMGRNVRTTSPHLRHRKYLTAEEGEAAASKKFGVHAEALRDIRTLPLATMRNRQALAGFQLIQEIKKLGRSVGEDWVAEGATPPGYFHMDHPAFFRWRLKMATNPETGKVEPAVDQAGNKQWDKVPLSVHDAWEGPLRAGLTQESSAAYRAFMDLKMRAMTNIMFSPLVQLHFLTEIGRAFPAAPAKIATTKLFMEGFQAKQDPATRLRAVMAGLVPVGRHGALQDISSITETQGLKPGRSWTSQILAAIPGLFDPRAGDAVKRAVDRIGDLLHGTLLWDRVEDLQFGLFLTLSDYGREKGLSPESADRLAAHQANRFAGTLPQESMSSFARKLSNILFFSRTYTLGNQGVFKDALGGLVGAGVNLVGRGVGRKEIGKNWGGLPLDVQAQIGRDAPEELARVQSLAKRRALSMLAVDVALMYGMSSLIQNAFAMWNGESMDEVVKGYVGRWRALEAEIQKNPFLVLNPFNVLMKLSPMAENEMDPATGMPLQRIFVGYDKEGTAIYARNPLGKYAEEILGWTTSPLATLKAKLNAVFVRPTLDVLANDRGFGRKIYLPTDDAAAILGKIAAHYIEAAVPMDQVTALRDMIEGKTKALDTEKMLGRTAGVTFRRGAPGGPAVGLRDRVRDEHEARQRDAMPGIMEQIKDGDLQGARQAMKQLGIRPRLQSWYIRVGRNPRLRLSGHALQDFMREASPEERAQMQRLRGASQ